VVLTDSRPAEGRAPTAPARGSRVDGTPGRSGAGRGGWVRSLLLGAALASALAGMHTTLQGVSWWLVGTAAAAVVLLAAAAVRALLRSVLWAPIAALAAGIVFLTVGFAADTAVLGLIPTLGTLPRLAAHVQAGVASIVEQRVPATPELGIVLLVAVLMIVCAWVADVVVAARRPALVALPLAVPLLVPLAILPGLADPLWFLVTAALYLVILRWGRLPDGRGVVLVTGAVVALGSLLLPLLLPAVEESPAVRAGGVRLGVNPLVSLGDDLRRGTPAAALSYTTTASEPVYLRLATLDSFGGDTWGPSAVGTRGDDLARFADPGGLGAATPTTPASVDVTVDALITSWLPLPYPTTSVRGVDDSWYWEPLGLTVRSDEASARGKSYRAEFLEVNPTSAQLDATVATFPPGVSGPLGLPEGVPGIILSTAHEVADAAGAGASAYAQALALQSYLRGAPFSYSEDTPVAEDFDGSGLDALAVFLEKKTGYCVHYASAMAVMARALGIPSRIAVGFQPGERHFVEGRNVFEVSTDDLHAWPELYFEGLGWLRFEPTPGRGSVPQYGSAPVDDPATPEDESTSTPSEAPSASPVAQQERDESVQSPAEQAAQQRTDAVLAVFGVLVLVVLVLLVPAALRAGVRMRRLFRMRRGRDPARHAWAEIRDTARDVGWAAPEWETPRAFSARLQAHGVPGGSALAGFRARVEASAFGPADAAPLSAAELASARRAVLRSVDRRRRVRAFLLPSSLLARWRPGD